MPEHASRFTAALYDQFEDEHRVADWGGDELFTRMPRPRAVDDAPAPRFRPYLAASGSEAPAPGPTAPAPERSLTLVERPEERQGTAATAEQAMLERAERLGLSLVGPEPGPRKTKVITGHPGGVPRPLPTVRAERRRPARTPAEWIGPRPERIVAWAFVLGLILILIAISTADAATL